VEDQWKENLDLTFISEELQVPVKMKPLEDLSTLMAPKSISKAKQKREFKPLEVFRFKAHKDSRHEAAMYCLLEVLNAPDRTVKKLYKDKLLREIEDLKEKALYGESRELNHVFLPGVSLGFVFRTLLQKMKSS